MITNAYDYYGSDIFSVMFSSAVEVGVSVSIVLAIIVLAIIVFCWLAKIEVTVSDKRVFGKAAFGKRVDLPLDSVSAVGTSALKGITVSTASGKISFLMIRNSDEIHKCISELLIARQSNKAQATVIKQEIPQSNADELKKFKELLDMGAITQDEYDIKKKQLLGM